MIAFLTAILHHTDCTTFITLFTLKFQNKIVITEDEKERISSELLEIGNDPAATLITV